MPGVGKRRLLRLTAGAARVELDASCVRRVVRGRGVTAIPLTRPQVLGVLISDNEVVPVYRLDEIPGLERSEEAGGPGSGVPGAGAIVILEEDGALAGFLVERAEFVTAGRQDGDETASLKTKHRLLAAAGVIADPPGPAASAVATAEGERHRDEEKGIPG